MSLLIRLAMRVGKRVSAAHPPCKSELMLLCERFQERFGRLSSNGKPTKIHLNECAIALGVPRRRLYDIINVFEAAEVSYPLQGREQTVPYLAAVPVPFSICVLYKSFMAPLQIYCLVSDVNSH